MFLLAAWYILRRRDPEPALEQAAGCPIHDGPIVMSGYRA
jgi:hypothetical protein